MPAVSFYLKKDVLASVRARAMTMRIPVSRIISDAVEQYLKTNEASEARKNVLTYLRKADWMGTWEGLHRERSRADADRG